MGLKETRDKYLSLHLRVSNDVTEAFSDIDNISIVLSSESDVDYVSRWVGVTDPNGITRNPPNGGWDWKKIYMGCIGDPHKFVVSIKCEDELCGIFYGAISRGKLVTKLHYLEAAPYKTPVSGYIIDISVTYTVSVANEVGSVHAAIYEPNDNLKSLALADFGFGNSNLYGTKAELNAIYYKI